MQTWIILFVAILSEVVATSALKASEGFSKLGPSVLVVVGYALAFYFLSLTLKVMSVGIAYAIWAGLGIVLTAIIGWLIFEQKLDTAALVGMGLILLGVIVINVFSNASGH
ncbi:Multidrug transporter EmrE [Marinomonas gallaica]|uniref:Multidrug transporter EmrE n=1 Tax=Marinomonas gallaica TaxID=1806667 RepID=A0A1C3JRG2_9GAMM|nr:multidrug efflux SMR transporter [Marinomonas gallaica]SBT17639.1 Multidrug transporter EmrE [Marinomonas gallaica]SBT19965.1 Multidrug transporter EmrE [Marinomonas gallaica]